MAMRKALSEERVDNTDGPLSAQAEFYRLGPQDIAQVAVLEKRCFSLPWEEKQFRLAFDQKVFSIFGLRKDHELVSYIAVYHTQYELEILNIASAPEHRRQGYAARLLALVLRIGVNMGIETAVLEVRRSNAPAITLYEQHGFAHMGIRKRYYADTGEDALVYTLSLNS